MKAKTLLIPAIAALFVLSCATGTPHSGALLCNETPFFIAEPTLEQTLVSGNQYSLEDISNYDEAFLTNQSGALLYNETPFFIAESALEQTLVSGDQYYLGDISNYDEAFLTNQSVIKEATDIKNVADYFAIMSVFDQSTPSVTEPTPEQTLASGTQYHLKDIYDYDVLFLIQPIVRQALGSGTRRHLEDIYDYDEMFFITQLRQTPVSGIEYDLAELYDYDETFPVTPAAGNQTLASGIQYYLEDLDKAYSEALPEGLRIQYLP